MKSNPGLGQEARDSAEKELYAELWIGDHANAPAAFYVDRDDASLQATIGNGDFILDHHGQYVSINKLIELDPSRFLGKAHLDEFVSVSDRYQKQMAFLLKLLSVGKAISIQAHPNQKLSEKLHAARPDVYRDHTHKPEIGVALSDDVASCFGFLNAEGIKMNLENSQVLSEVFKYEKRVT